MQITDEPIGIAVRPPRRTAPRFASFEGDNTCQFMIFVEDIVLVPLKSFSKSLILWFATHYILNLEYAKTIKEVALFFQEFICNLPATGADKKTKNATYLSVTTDIQKYIS